MAKVNIKKKTLNIEDIKETQKNRYPLLFIDRIIDHQPGKWAVGKKNFSYNEWFFPPHYEDEANVPGFILIECLVQTFIMTFLTIKEHKGCKTNFLDIKYAKFRKKVLPGDTMIINSNLKTFKRGIAIGKATGMVDDTIVCTAEFAVSLPNSFENLTPKIKHNS